MSQSRLAWFKQMDWVSWATAVLIVVLPLPRHWVLIAQPYAGINAVLTDFGLSVGELVALVLVAGTAVSNVFNAKAQSQKGAKRKRKSIVLTLLGGLTLLTLLSSVWALDSVLAFQQGMRLLLLFGLVVAVGQRGVNETAVQTGIALSLAVQAGTALVQFITQDDLGLRLLGELDLNRYPGGGSILTVGETYWLRSYGLTPHPNIAGGVLAALLLLGTAVYLQSRRAKPIWLLLLLLGTAGLVVTFSRSAWLGTATGGGMWAGMVGFKKEWRGQYGRSLLLLGLPVLLIVGSLLWSQRALLQTRIDTESAATEARSLNERQELIEIGADFFRIAPLVGIGAANFAVAAIPIAAQSHELAPQPIHHIPRLLAAELGIGGSLLWSALLLLPLVVALNLHRHGRLTVWAAGVTAALAALAVIDLFDYYAWGWAQGRLLRWLLWGLWLAAAAMPPKSPD